MGVCKNCGKVINYLRQVSSGIEKCDIFYNKKEKWIDWKNEEFESDGIVRIFYCPECNEELDFDEQQAEEFLKEEDELQQIVAEKINKIKEENKK